MSHLVAVLHSLAPGTGARTRSRVDIARNALGCATSSVVNLYPAPLPSVNALQDPVAEVWVRGRLEIEDALRRPDCTDIVLGYGIQEPIGRARHEFRAQVAWLQDVLTRVEARVWVVGGRPTHPSRWHRVSFRQTPGRPFEEAARELLEPYTLVREDA